MKTNLILLYLVLLSATVYGQEDSSSVQQDRLYFGLGLTTVTYHIYYNDSKLPPDVKAGYFTPVLFNVGYQLNNKFRVQIGLGYGGSKDKLEWSLNHRNTDTAQYSTSTKTHVIAIPVSAHLVLFKALKRFPVYATGSVLTAYGSTRANVIETVNGEPSSQNFKESGVNLFAAAGFGFNYRISTRLMGYTEWLPFKENLTGQNSFHYDWEQFSSKGRRFFRSFSVGINYKLKP